MTKNKERCNRSDLILPCIYIFIAALIALFLVCLMFFCWTEKIMPDIRSRAVRIALAHYDMDTGCLAPGCSTFMSCGL